MHILQHMRLACDVLSTGQRPGMHCFKCFQDLSEIGIEVDRRKVDALLIRCFQEPGVIKVASMDALRIGSF